MTTWWAAFILIGVLYPPHDHQRATVTAVAFLVTLAAYLTESNDTVHPAPNGAAVSPAEPPRSRMSRARGACKLIAPALQPVGSIRAVTFSRFAVVCATSIVLWMGAGVERERLGTVRTGMVPVSIRGGAGMSGSTAAGSRTDEVDHTGQHANRLRGGIGAVRRQLLAALDDDRLSQRSRELLGAAILAHRAGLHASLRDAYEYLGIAHLLALSGLHLGILSLPVIKLLSHVRLSRLARDVLLLLVLSTYAAVAGFPPSLIRALCLVASFVIHRTLGVRIGLFRCLLFGGTAIAIIDFPMVLNAGFQLSFTAVVGIALIGIPLIERVQKLIPRGFIATVSRFTIFSILITCSVQLFSLPIVLALFKRASLVSPLVNCIIILPFTALLYCGAAFLFVPIDPLRTILSVPINFLTYVLWSLPERFSQGPHPAVYAGDVDPVLYCAGMLFLSLSLLRGCTHRAVLVTIAAAALVLSVIAGAVGFNTGAKRTMGGGMERVDGERVVRRFTGDCILVRSCGGVLFVPVDIGWAQGRRLVRDLWGVGQRRVRCLILAQGGSGRRRGSIQVMERIGVEELLCSPYLAAARPDILESASRLGVPVLTVVRGDTIRRGSCTITVLDPVFPPCRGRSPTPQQASLRCRMNLPVAAPPFHRWIELKPR